MLQRDLILRYMKSDLELIKFTRRKKIHHFISDIKR